MSRVRLDLPKIHKARITRAPAEAKPVEESDLIAMSPEAELISEVAVLAEEVMPAPAPAIIASVKQPWRVRARAKFVQPLAVARQRRAVLRAVKQPATASEPNIDNPNQTRLAEKLTTEAIQITPLSRRRGRRPSREDLINAESKLGSTIFGPVPAGHRREFFHDQANVWIWHESWVDEVRQQAWELTVRYEVRPTGVYKKLSAGHYVRLEGEELENFRQAAHAYLGLIKSQLYHSA